MTDMVPRRCTGGPVFYIWDGAGSYEKDVTSKIALLRVQYGIDTLAS